MHFNIITKSTSQSWDSAVGTVTSYMTDEEGTGTRFPSVTKDSTFAKAPKPVQESTASDSIRTRGSFIRCKTITLFD